MIADDGRRVRRRRHACQSDRCKSHEDVIAHQSFLCLVDHCEPPDSRLDRPAGMICVVNHAMIVDALTIAPHPIGGEAGSDTSLIRAT
jgi:hypothetical protein